MVYSDKRVALGSECTITISFLESDDKLIEMLSQQLWLKIFQFEQNFSRFLPSSQLTKFNDNSGAKQSITPEFKELLLACQKYSILTDGIFNPFILPALEQVGYDHSLLPGFEKDLYIKHPNARLIDYRALEIFEDKAYIPKESAIDLGGLGKGFLADKLAKFLLGYKDRIIGFWISLGGDIHCYGLEDINNPWKIYIEKDSLAKTEDIGYIESTKGQSISIASSGTQYRRGIKDNKTWHHIIDPRTGLSAETNISSATVVSDTTIFCDVIASCLVIEVKENNLKQICQKYKVEDGLIQGYINNRIEDDYYYKVFGKRIKINNND